MWENQNASSLISDFLFIRDTIRIKNRNLISDSSITDMFSGKLSPEVAAAFDANQAALEVLLEGGDDGKENVSE